jgi:hypothetical protein
MQYFHLTQTHTITTGTLCLRVIDLLIHGLTEAGAECMAMDFLCGWWFSLFCYILCLQGHLSLCVLKCLFYHILTEAIIKEVTFSVYGLNLTTHQHTAGMQAITCASRTEEQLSQVCSVSLPHLYPSAPSTTQAVEHSASHVPASLGDYDYLFSTLH